MSAPRHRKRSERYGNAGGPGSLPARGVGIRITTIAAYFNYINRVADALGVGKPAE